MTSDIDVIVIGAGGGGAVIAKELGEKGLSVLVLEAGPWYGNKEWPNPNKEPGGSISSNFEDLSRSILSENFTEYEDEMNDLVSGKLRWGPANRNHTPWYRKIPQGGFAWTVSGVGGTTQVYYANSPRAYPSAVNDIWPISYDELIPYYEKVEETLPVLPAPMTAKEELFFYGAQKAGWSLINTKNVTQPGYRPQPNAIFQPYFTTDEPIPDTIPPIGCTLRGHCVNGCPAGTTVDTIAKRTTLCSYIPLALKTGNVTVRPNTFVTEILTEKDTNNELKATGVKFRDTWSGEVGELTSKSIVMSAGAIETPRLWLNSNLPYNPWVGKGLSTHWFDTISGIFEEKDLINILGTPEVGPYIGQNAAARFDYPGLGMLLAFGMSPGLTSLLTYGSGTGYSSLNEHNPTAPWDLLGKVTGSELKEFMAQYPRTLNILVIMDDGTEIQNGITVDRNLKDEHGFIPIIHYTPTKQDAKKREQLAYIASDILKKAGAKKVIRSDLSSGVFLHLECTMRLGFVTDLNCEALQVQRLFIADNSVLYNGLGGPNPTLSTQALATRTAEKLALKYFS